jgi:hypothetical protein
MKSLQQWYRDINGIYVDRNFYRSLESIFCHLVEVSRGLSVAATVRRKKHLNPREFLPKTLAWWFALCGRAGVPDVENMLWTKFPQSAIKESLDLFLQEASPRRIRKDSGFSQLVLLC